MSQTAALPRIRIRLRKPPNSWVLWWRLLGLSALAQIAHAIWLMAKEGPHWYAWINLAPVAILAFLYHNSRIAARHVEHAQIAPPDRSAWLVLGGIWLMVLALWTVQS